MGMAAGRKVRSIERTQEIVLKIPPSQIEREIVVDSSYKRGHVRVGIIAPHDIEIPNPTLRDISRQSLVTDW